MRTYLRVFLLLFALHANAQDAPEAATTKPSDSLRGNLTHTRWQAEGGFGYSQGVRPYNEGYYATYNDKPFGKIRLNSFTAGVTYNFSRTLGLRGDLAFDHLKDIDDNSLDFETVYLRMSFQAVLNITSLLNTNYEAWRFQLLAHGGINLGSLIAVRTKLNQVIGSPDLTGGLVIGVRPQYRITRKSFVFFDFSMFTNYRQNNAWDGRPAEENENLTAKLVNASVGITYSFGKPLGK